MALLRDYVIRYELRQYNLCGNVLSDNVTDLGIMTARWNDLIDLLLLLLPPDRSFNYTT